MQLGLLIAYLTQRLYLILKSGMTSTYNIEREQLKFLDSFEFDDYETQFFNCIIVRIEHTAYTKSIST